MYKWFVDAVAVLTRSQYKAGRYNDSFNTQSIFIRDCMYGHHTGLYINCNNKIILAFLL